MVRWQQQGQEEMKRSGLGKWFDQDWRDVKSKGSKKPCGRSKGEKRKYPACRPKKVASKITKKEAGKKTGSKRVSWSVTPSGKKRSNASRKKR